MKIGVLLAIVICSLMVLGASSMRSYSATPSVYVTKCQPCHGATGAGESPTGRMLNVKSFNDSTVISMDDPSLSNVILDGSGNMPAYRETLTDDQISNLVQYLHQLQTNLQSN